MNLKQMSYILEISRCGSVHATARKLFVSQPALSQHLQRVEEELGIRIFQRSTGALHVTYEGRKVLDTFEKMLFEYKQLENFIEETADLKHGELNIGFPPVRSMQFMPVLLPGFRKQYPGIRINLSEHTSSGMSELIRSGEIDMGLFTVENYAGDLDFIPLIREEMFLAVAPDSEADRICRTCTSKGKPVDITLLKDQPFILPKSTSNVRENANRLFAKYGMQPEIVMEATTIDLGVALAATGIGVSMVSRVFMHFNSSVYRPNLYPLSHEIEGYRLGILCNPNHYRSEAMRVFIDYTKDVIRQFPFQALED